MAAEEGAHPGGREQDYHARTWCGFRVRDDAHEFDERFRKVNPGVKFCWTYLASGLYKMIDVMLTTKLLQGCRYAYRRKRDGQMVKGETLGIPIWIEGKGHCGTTATRIKYRLLTHNLDSIPLKYKDAAVELDTNGEPMYLYIKDIRQRFSVRDYASLRQFWKWEVQRFLLCTQGLLPLTVQHRVLEHFEWKYD